MAAETVSPDSVIKMPLMALYAGCVIAREQNRTADFQILKDALVQAVNTPEGRRLAEQALSGMPASLIPFLRDEVEIYAACASPNVSREGSFRFYSDASVIRAGYFQIRSGDSHSYFDRLVINNAPKREEPKEIFPRTRQQELVRTVLSIDQTRAAVVVPADPNSLLEFESDALETCIQTPAKRHVKIALLRGGESGNAIGLKRELTSASLKRRAAGVYALVLKPEHTMEIHAAAIAGHWLLIDGEEIRLLAPLPDFDTIGARVDAWLQPSRVFSDACGLEQTPILALNQKLAESLMRRHRWCGADDAVDWFSAIQRSG